jgi:hypothetical protein
LCCARARGSVVPAANMGTLAVASNALAARKIDAMVLIAKTSVVVSAA